jgi:hypothetical protein
MIKAFRPDLAQGRCVKFINTNELAVLFLSRFQVASRRRLSPRPSSIPSALPPFAARILWSSGKGLSVGEGRAVTLFLRKCRVTTDEAMCVCVCVCVCVCITYVCMYYTYVYTYVYTYECMYVCMYIHTYVCMYVYTYVCMYVCMYVYTYVCMYLCMYVCIYIRIYIHVTS